MARAGDYLLWGRVQTPTPDDDSFYVRLLKDGVDLIGRADWATGTHPAWEWTRAVLGRAGEMKSLSLPQGEVLLRLQVREDGTRIDRLFLTPDPTETPR